MDDLNRIIHGLWIGKRLTRLELLTIRSFLENGHEFHLWLYDAVENDLPEGTIVEDASSILPRESVFRYRHRNQFGHGKGSYAGFSDIFRYKLLHNHGGWWSDMDVTCLKPLDFAEPYLFKSHHSLPAVGNLMKCPPRSALMKICFERAICEVDADNRDWHKPIQILIDGIKEFGLTGFVKSDLSNLDRWAVIEPFILGKAPIPDSYYTIHWCNESWRSRGVTRTNYREDSTFGMLLRRYGLANGSGYK